MNLNKCTSVKNKKKTTTKHFIPVLLPNEVCKFASESRQSEATALITLKTLYYVVW